jgi:DNA invertase Pin-like site-specific DNA recombinase
MRSALYVRTSTLDQTVENQERELRAVAERLGHEIVEVYADNGISGAKGRDKRPAFDRLCRDATRRRFDMIMAWSVDRLGRSLQDLVGFLSEIHASHVELYLHQQGLDTSTPSGRAMFQMMGVFAEFERAMIAERVRSGMARAKAKGTKSGKPIGRPRIDPRVKSAIRAAYTAGGVGLRAVAKEFGVGVETARRALIDQIC